MSIDILETAEVIEVLENYLDEIRPP